MNRIRSVSVSSVATGLSVVLLITVGMPAVARAECVALWKTARDAQRVATVVFSGTVVGTDGSLETSFEVTRVWKGDLRRATTLTLFPGIESHGASYFKAGTAYLVFASAMSKLVRTDDGRDTPVFEISVCSPTRPLADAQEFVNQLGRGRPPRP
jgi:hypothetical protein